MPTKLTSTTGTVKGEQEVKDFLRMANKKFNEVIMEDAKMPVEGYIQYTLLTNNRIKIWK